MHMKLQFQAQLPGISESQVQRAFDNKMSVVDQVLAFVA